LETLAVGNTWRLETPGGWKHLAVGNTWRLETAATQTKPAFAGWKYLFAILPWRFQGPKL
jgi:hypothetical protein